MEPEGSLPLSQVSATFLCPDPHLFSHCPLHTCWRSILMLSSHLRLSSKWCIFLRFPHLKTLYAPFLSPVSATSAAHHILLDLITRIVFGEEYRVWSCLLWSFLHSPVTSSHLGPRVVLSTLFSKILILCSALSVREKFHTHAWKMYCGFSVLYRWTAVRESL
jgi:hypothetical protein